MKDTTTKDTTMRQKNTPTITKGIVTNHMTTKAIIMIMKVTIMTIRTIATIMKAITMRDIIMTLTKATTMPRKFTTMMPMLMKVIITMLTKVTTMATTTEAIRMKSSSHHTRPRQQV